MYLCVGVLIANLSRKFKLCSSRFHSLRNVYYNVGNISVGVTVQCVTVLTEDSVVNTNRIRSCLLTLKALWTCVCLFLVGFFCAAKHLH